MEKDTEQLRFSPAACRDDEQQDPSSFLRYLRPGVIAIGILFILLHIEVGFGAAAQAPETVLVQVLDDAGQPEEAAQCYADIVSEEVNAKKKPLRGLASIYEVLDPHAFQADVDVGFYLLKTGLAPGTEAYELRIVCYSPGFAGVSHTIVNQNNTQACSIKENGRLLLCTN